MLEGAEMALSEIQVAAARDANGKKPPPPPLGRLVLLDHATSPEILAQFLKKGDSVHTQGAQMLEDLLAYRLPRTPNDNRMCWAAIDDAGKIQCIMFAHKSERPVNDPDDLCGNVREILESPVRELQGPVRQLIFYTISGYVDGIAPEFIRAVHQQISGDEQLKDAVLSTLSPTRSFDAYMIMRGKHPDFDSLGVEEQKNLLIPMIKKIDKMRDTPDGRAELDGLCEKYAAPIDSLSEAEQKRLMLKYLSLGVDPVQKFHMGNGGRIAHIRLCAGDSDGRYQIMINYEYNHDMAVLLTNRASFKESGIVGLVGECPIEDTKMYHLRGVDRDPYFQAFLWQRRSVDVSNLTDLEIVRGLVRRVKAIEKGADTGGAFESFCRLNPADRQRVVDDFKDLFVRYGDLRAERRLIDGIALAITFDTHRPYPPQRGLHLAAG